MSRKEELWKTIEKGIQAGPYEKCAMFLMTDIALSLAVIADALEGIAQARKEMEDKS